MTDYPYNFGNGYKVQTVFANKTETGVYGDIYDFRSEVERAHPGAEIMTGYCVIDEALGLIPDGCNDWNDTIAEAIQDYEEHVVPVLEAPLAFIFDEEVTVSPDGAKLEGYVWATDALVARLHIQEPPLSEDESLENINFYPVLDVANRSVTLEGHYYLEDGHHAMGKGFTLSLSEEESESLINAFEAYCLKMEGKTCAEFLKSVLSSEPSLKAVDIQWDVDDPADLEELPTEMEIPAHLTYEEDISDFLSDETGFCHGGFRLVEIKAANKDALFEQLKSELFMQGTDAIEDFLGYEIDPDEDKDVTDRRMDMAYEQMPEDILNQYYAKYNIGSKASLSEQIRSAGHRMAEASDVPAKDIEQDR